MDLYIYYKVATRDAHILQSRVATMQAELVATATVTASLKCRPEPQDGLQTWMEIYMNVPEGFNTMLDKAVAAAELSLLIVGNRHAEIFVDCPPCA